jgi:hypothetical protein
MSASTLFPKSWQGKPDSSGYLARNDRPTSRSSPGWRGRVYVAEPGWHWLSGWVVHPRENEKPVLNLKLRGMTDQEAQQYCAPKGAPRQSAAPAQQQVPLEPRQSTPAVDQYGDDDIPF